MPDEQWPSYWSINLDDGARRHLEAELRREVPVGHVLYKASVVAKAIGEDSDDVVFELPDGRLAAVHLTGYVEHRTDMPYTRIFPDVKALADEW
jgi:hypothetical protein